jgi:hypothetical protein
LPAGIPDREHHPVPEPVEKPGPGRAFGDQPDVVQNPHVQAGRVRRPDQPVAGRRRVPEPERPNRRAAQLPLADVDAGSLSQRGLQQAFPVLGLGPLHGVEQLAAADVFARRPFQADAGPAGQDLARFLERDLLKLGDEREYVPLLPARPAPEVLPLGVHLKGRPRVVMERADGLVDAAGRVQGEVRTDHGDDVAGLLHLPRQSDPVVGHAGTCGRAPPGSRAFTGRAGVVRGSGNGENRPRVEE